MKVGDLVKLDLHLSFTSGIKYAIGIPFDAIGIVIQEECDVCSILFPSLDDEIRSFIKKDLQVLSENESI
jgi:hypothetical protein